MMPTLAPLILAFTVLAEPCAGQAPSPEMRDEVRALLGAIHGGVPPDAFRALGPGVEEVLADFARGDEPPLRRIRALDALAGLHASCAEPIHREIAGSPSAPAAVRKAAVRGLARLAGPSRATREVAPFMEGDRDPTVRAAAAEALAGVAPTHACARIRTQARTEQNPARYRRALALCDRPSRPARER